MSSTAMNDTRKRALQMNAGSQIHSLLTPGLKPVTSKTAINHAAKNRQNLRAAQLKNAMDRAEAEEKRREPVFKMERFKHIDSVVKKEGVPQTPAQREMQTHSFARKGEGKGLTAKLNALNVTSNNRRRNTLPTTTGTAMMNHGASVSAGGAQSYELDENNTEYQHQQEEDESIYGHQNNQQQQYDDQQYSSHNNQYQHHQPQQYDDYPSPQQQQLSPQPSYPNQHQSYNHSPQPQSSSYPSHQSQHQSYQQYNQPQQQQQQYDEDDDSLNSLLASSQRVETGRNNGNNGFGIPSSTRVHQTTVTSTSTANPDKSSSSSNFITSNARSVIAASRALASSRDEQSRQRPTSGKHENYGRVPDYLINTKAELEKKKQAALDAEREKNSDIPPGMILMPEEQRLQTLKVLEENRQKIMNDISAFPLRCETNARKRAKAEMEQKLEEIEKALQLFGRKRVLIQP